MQITPIQKQNYYNQSFSGQIKIKVTKTMLQSMLDKGLSNTEIANELKCSRSSVSRILKDYELSPVYARNMKSAAQQINKYVEEGLSVNEITELTGYGRTKIYSSQKKSQGALPLKLAIEKNNNSGYGRAQKWFEHSRNS